MCDLVLCRNTNRARKAARVLNSVFQVLCKTEQEPPKFRPSFEIAATFPSSSSMHKFQRVDTATC